MTDYQLARSIVHPATILMIICDCWIFAPCVDVNYIFYFLTNMFLFFRKILSVGIAVAITLFIVTNVTCAVIIRSSLGDVLGVFQAVSLCRVAINDTLFIVFGVALAAYIYKMSKMPTSEVVLEARVSNVVSWFDFIVS